MNISSMLLGFWYFWGIYRAKRRPGGTRGGHNPPGRAWASWRTLVGCPLLGTPPRCNQGPTSFFSSIKNHGEVSLHLDPSDIDFLRCKNMEKTATGTWHYVNRLVPKNDIK